MMRLFVTVLLFGLCVQFSSPVYANTFESGLTAYEAGDYAHAKEVWRGLANKGDVEAQFSLGNLYATGQGVPKDYTNAVLWYRFAAEQGHVQAQLYLGYYYSKGRGVAMSGKEALKWYTSAAEQGHVDAQYNLGALWFKGKGVSKSNVNAYVWWKVAAESGSGAAQKQLSKLTKKMLALDIDEAETIAAEKLALISERLGQ
jgi:uncharacterized protein